ncbi:phage tail assembly chaperone [Nereida sp. MMG025]|uniref:phage tail assembly chaperone n=1 Tax=Nereida sp. MMG025 TaxID=2909981 RepID=UPI001F455E7E|nr:phage tail assembly chaperone [Nereida sp. MMG025]MCF6443484.1 phage tail assembly chaperone [Nereida sp. MMG025]
MPADGLDWGALMRVGLGQAGLPPATFWAMTPYEFSLSLGLEPPQTPLRFQGFADLMAAFPDGADDQKGHQDE